MRRILAIGSRPDRAPLPDLRLHPWAPHLFPVQVQALQEMRDSVAPRGVVLMIIAGGGKTLIGGLAGRIMQCRKPLMIVPSSLIAQTEQRLTEWSEHYPIDPRPVVIGYGALSAKKGRQILADLEPDLIILDEAHRIRSRDSARTKRLMSYAKAHEATRWVVMSGTLIAKTAVDWLIPGMLALREGVPLPLHHLDVLAWERATVAPKPGEIVRFADVESLAPLRKAVGIKAKPGIDGHIQANRQAVHRLIEGTPGIVVSRDAVCGAPLRLRWLDFPTVCRDQLAKLEEQWELPDGSEIVQASDMARAREQLALGYYLRWTEAVDGSWREARREWHRCVRGALRLATDKSVDTPGLLAEAAANGQASRAIVKAWHAYQAEGGDSIRPPTAAIWLDHSAMDYLTKWALDFGPDLVTWVRSVAIQEALASRGLPVYGAGSSVPREIGALPVVLSSQSFGEGTELQHYASQIIVEPPRSASPWEQLLGRLHRPGQKADEVEVFLRSHHKGLLHRVKQEAIALADLTGSKQRLQILE